MAHVILLLARTKCLSAKQSNPFFSDADPWNKEMHSKGRLGTSVTSGEREGIWQQREPRPPAEWAECQPQTLIREKEIINTFMPVSSMTQIKWTNPLRDAN